MQLLLLDSVHSFARPNMSAFNKHHCLFMSIINKHAENVFLFCQITEILEDLLLIHENKIIGLCWHPYLPIIKILGNQIKSNAREFITS